MRLVSATLSDIEGYIILIASFPGSHCLPMTPTISSTMTMNGKEVNVPCYQLKIRKYFLLTFKLNAIRGRKCLATNATTGNSLMCEGSVHVLLQRCSPSWVTTQGYLYLKYCMHMHVKIYSTEA